MILAADIGNSNIVLGLIENGAIRNIIRIHTDLRYTSAEYGIQLRQLLEYYNVKPDRIEGAILSSAVPPITGTVADAIRTIIGQDCLTVGPGIKTGMNVRIEDPGSL